MKRIADAELIALAALVQARAAEVTAANAERAWLEQGPAYASFWPCPEAELIENELRARGIVS